MSFKDPAAAGGRRAHPEHLRSAGPRDYAVVWWDPATQRWRASHAMPLGQAELWASKLRLGELRAHPRGADPDHVLIHRAQDIVNLGMPEGPPRGRGASARARAAAGRRVQPWEAPPLRAEDIVYGPRYLGTNRGFRLPDGSVQGDGFFVVTRSGWVYLGNPDVDPDEPPYEFEIVRAWSPQEWSREPGALEIMQAFARTEGPGALALPHLHGGTGGRLAARRGRLNRPRIR